MKDDKKDEKKDEKKELETSPEDETIHYDIDKFIEQLYECKPLKEEEVKFLIEKSKEILSQEKMFKKFHVQLLFVGISMANFMIY